MILRAHFPQSAGCARPRVHYAPLSDETVNAQIRYDSRICSTGLREKPDVDCAMRYLVKARLKPGKDKPLLQSLADGTLGQGSIAGDEYAYDMEQARVSEDGLAHWVETCF